MPTYKNTTYLSINNIEDELGIVRNIDPGNSIKTKKIYSIVGLVETSSLPYYTPNLSSTMITSSSDGDTIQIGFNKNANKWMLINDSQSMITIYYNHLDYDGYIVLPTFTAQDSDLKDKKIEFIYLVCGGEIFEGEAIFQQFR